MKYKIIELKKESKKYPKSLFGLEDPPLKISVIGDTSLLYEPQSLAVVGSRRMTRYGGDTVNSLVTSLSAQGVVIVSGFMYGVDTAAHRAAINAGGKTIAVLAHGLNYIYPPENKKLYTEILQSGGALVSEYTADFKPQLWTYPKRNRIVAALATLGTLVVEAAEQSGSLITASYADALNRPLYAVPGSVFSSVSRGTNTLIKNGIAKMVTEASDILPEFSSNDVDVPTLFDDFSELDRKIIETLESEDLILDEIARKIKGNISEISVALSMLAIKGVIEEYGGKYRKSRKK